MVDGLEPFKLFSNDLCKLLIFFELDEEEFEDVSKVFRR